MEDGVKLIHLAIMLSLLLVRGDIHSNPGPVIVGDNKYIEICHINMSSLKPQDRSVKLDEMYTTLCLEKEFDVICVLVKPG